jgi:hypothetical protein
VLLELLLSVVGEEAAGLAALSDASDLSDVPLDVVVDFSASIAFLRDSDG